MIKINIQCTKCEQKEERITEDRNFTGVFFEKFDIFEVRDGANSIVCATCEKKGK